MGSSKKRPSSERRFGSSLLRFDMFGETVAMTVAGESSYNTFCGLLITIIVAAAVIIFAGLATIQLVDYQSTSYQNTEVENAIDVDTVYSYEDTHFAIAIGLVDQYKRPSKMISSGEESKYFKITGWTTKRAVSGDDDKEADAVKSEVGFH